jgi:lipoprotein-anchoring transpeptidase ErfK/SrfK
MDRAQAFMGAGKPGKYIEADLNRQILTISENGNVIWVFDISSGKRSTPTPRGNFRLTRQVNALRISNLGQLWRPKYFTGGYALHGSPSVPNYPASHGCVRIPLWVATRIYSLVDYGTNVYIYW